ncbi:MAG: protein phosphatase 2C domain-containing protein [Rhodovarius sp.]|nr:protein phosphatase 2C domain-containing protein [Rhodovarius sp.]
MQAWRYAARSVVGGSHLKAGMPCQDHSEITVVSPQKNIEVVLAAVADGAGSAAQSHRGARECCLQFLELAHLAACRTLERVDFIDGAFCRVLIENIQNELRRLAEVEGISITSFASTFLGAIVTESAAVFLQIGDGAIVYRPFEAQRKTGGSWVTAIPPQRGEFAGQTMFVTTPNAAQWVVFRQVSEPLAEFALLTDGVEFLSISQRSGLPHAPFFEHVFRGLREAPLPGRCQAYEEWLEEFLSSPRVCERTDDDKTLALCTRLPPA